MQASVEESIRERAEVLRAEIGQAADAARAASAAADSMVISRCHLQPKDLQQLLEIQNSPDLAGSKGEKKHKQALVCPEPTDQAVFEALQQRAVLSPHQSAEWSATARQIARLRLQFQDAVFIMQPESLSPRSFKFLFASLQPLQLSFLPLTETATRVAPPLLRTKEAWEQWGLAEETYRWRYEQGLVDLSDVFADNEPTQIGVVLHTAFSQHSEVSSCDLLQPLEMLLAAAADSATSRPSTTAASSQAASASAAKTLPPWVDHALANTRPGQSHSKASAASELPPEDPELSAGDVDSDADVHESYQAAYADLEAHRLAHPAAVQPVLEDFFRFAVRGGAWQAQRTGRAVYGLRVDIRHDTELFSFAQHFNLSRSASFERNVYGDNGGQALAKIWAGRLQHLFQHWDSQGRPSDFPVQDLPPYEVAPDLLAQTASFTNRASARLKKVRELLP